MATPERSSEMNLYPVCGAESRLAAPDVLWYTASLVYWVQSCLSCGVSYAWSRTSDPAVCDLIYKSSSRLPGYGLYSLHTKMVK